MQFWYAKLPASQERPQKFTLPEGVESGRRSGGLHEETSRGLFQSCSCWRPESLRGRTIHFSLRDSGGFREVRDEAAGAGVAESGTAGPYPDQFPPGGPAISVENEYRHDSLLGGRTGERKQPSA